jgi:C4-dicarboxylate-specific signal transduction histidine kinase
LRQLEADLAHVNRVSMMGELAASLAHEIKQPLTAAVVNAQAGLRWLERPVPDMARASRAARSMVRDVTHAAEIIDGMRALSGRGTPQRERVDVNALVHEMVVVLRNRAERQNVVVRTALDPTLPTVVADRVQLQQVLMNLMVNGIEAMQTTGGELLVSSSRAADGSVVMTVRDDGVGLPVDGAERLFAAFVTTKPQGTGLGLSISRRIIEAHGGRLWASANAERGATFQFMVPGEGRTD